MKIALMLFVLTLGLIFFFGMAEITSAISIMTIYVVPDITDNKILPTSSISSSYISNNISIVASPGEYEPASFVIRANENINSLQVEATDLTGAGGIIPSSNVDIRVVKVWYQGGSGDTIRGDLGIYGYYYTPELLLKDDSLVRVDGADWNQWSVSNPNGRNYLKLTSGNYVDISDNWKSKSGLEITPITSLPVRDSAILQPVSISTGTNKQFWVTIKVPDGAVAGDYTGRIELRTGAGLIGELQLQVRVLPIVLSRPNTGYSVYYRGTLKDVGSISSENKNSQQFRAEMENLYNHGVTNPTFYPMDSLAKLGEVLAIRNEVGMGNQPLYYLGETFGNDATFKSYVQARGVTETYFYGIDEGSASANRVEVDNFHNRGFKAFVALSQSNADAIADVLDLVIAADWSNGPSISLANKYHNYGHKIFSYANPQVMPEYPRLFRMNYGLLLWQRNYDGAMDYAYQHSYGSIWNDFDSTEIRDEVFAYPTMDGVIDTIQWEGFREGVDDIRYITTLQKTITTAKANGKDTSAAENWLASLKTADLSTRNLDTVRSEMINYILSLQTTASDTTPPTASISIKSGASATSSPSVALTLPCSDASGIKDVRYSNDGTFDTEPWETYASTKSWTLTSGDGTKTVWYQCRDNSPSQNIATVSDTIILDTTNPSTSIQCNSAACSASYAGSVSVSLSCSDSASGCKSIRYCVDQSNVCSPGTVYSSQFTVSTVGTNYVRYYSDDNAGNAEIIKSQQIGITAAPLDFSVSTTPASATVTPGSSTTATVNINLLSGATQPVTLSASGEIPVGAVVSFIKGSCNPTCSDTMSISTSANTPTGSYTIAITGIGGGVTKSIPYTLTVSTTTTLQISFIDPTDANGATITRDWTYAKTAVVSSNPIDTFLINWNGVDISTKGLVGLWHLNNDAKDYSGNGNDGTISGAVAVAGKYGSALKFDGINDYVNVLNSNSLNIIDKITIETWVKPNVAGEGGANAGLVSKAEAGVGWSWQLRYNAPGGNYMGFQFNGNPEGPTWVSVKQNLLPGEWYHIVGVFNGTNIKSYLNGVEKDINRISAIKGSNSILFIGQDGWGNGFNGNVDEVRIYNRALSATEISANYQTEFDKYYMNKTDLAVGSYSYYAWINDTAGSWARSESRTLTVASADTTPPVISSLTVSNIKKDSADVRWNTDDASNSTVNYDTTIALSKSKSNSSFVTSRTIQLTGLLMNTIYYYRSSSCNVNNLCNSSSTNSFTTLYSKIQFDKHKEKTHPVAKTPVADDNVVIEIPLIYDNVGIEIVSVEKPNWYNMSNVRINQSGSITAATVNATHISWQAILSNENYLLFEVPAPIIANVKTAFNVTFFQKNFTVSSLNSLENVSAYVEVNSSYKNWVLYWFNSSWIDATSLFKLSVTNGTAVFYGFDTSDQQFRVEGNTENCIDADGDTYYSPVDCSVRRDCDDNNAAINPGAAEICGNSIDENCDGVIEACPTPSPSPSGGGGGSYSSETVTPTATTVTPITEPIKEETIPPLASIKGEVEVKLITPDRVESGEYFNATIVLKSPREQNVSLKIAGIEETVSLQANIEKQLTYELLAPESIGSFSVVTEATDGDYSSDAKIIELDYKPLFLYVNKTVDIKNGMTWLNILVKNYEENSRTSIEITKGGSLVFGDTFNGSKNYETNVTLKEAGEYRIIAKSFSGDVVTDEDVRYVKVTAGGKIEFKLILLIVGAIAVVSLSVVMFIRSFSRVSFPTSTEKI